MGKGFRTSCEKHKVSQSVGLIGSSQDNAVAESFWASLKRELVSRDRFATRAEACRAIIAWVNRYNAVRLHSTLGNVPPLEWELRYAHRDLLAA
jgi:putative transposase